MKEDIQEHLDELIEKQKNDNKIATYYGVPIIEFSKDELIAVLKELDEHRRFYK